MAARLVGASRQTPRVLLVDLDGGAVAERLTAAQSFELVPVSSFAEALAALATAKPDAVVVALREPAATDVEATSQLVRSSSSPVLLVSEPVPDKRAVELIKTGTSGYLFTRDVPYIATSLRQLLRGGVPMSEAISRLVMQRARKNSVEIAAVRPGDVPARQLLSGRQREILGLLQHGHSYEDIGIALGLALNTVRSHVRVLYERLGAATKVEAVMIAMELGILERTRLSDRPPPPAR